MTRTAVATFVAALLLSALARTAAADDATVAAALADIRTDRAALRYRDALAAVDRALALGKASPSQLAELYRTAGELAGGLDEPTSAEGWFTRWLLLVPDARLSADASPKVRAPLESARAGLAGAALAIDVTASADNRTATVTVAGDALGLVRSVRLRAADGTATQNGLPGAPLSVVPGSSLTAAALDEHGNELVVQPFTVMSGPGTGTGAGRPIYGRWQTWATSTAVLAATGGGFAWRMNVAQDEFDRLRAESDMHTFDELEAVRRRGERYALTADIAFGAAAITAVVTVVLVVKNRSERNRGAVTLAPALGPGHAGVALAGRL